MSGFRSSLITSSGFRSSLITTSRGASFKGSDYGNSIATVLASAHNTRAGLLITDPVASSPGGGLGTHDTLLLKGITKHQLAQNQDDIAFHA